MTHAPDRGFLSKFGQTGVALLWMVGLQVEDVKFRFESGHDQFVHVDVRTIEFKSANTIL